jgi:hypothetical protein
MEPSCEEASRVSPVEQLNPDDMLEALAAYFDLENESDKSEEKRRLHRESMATARKRLRMSIDKLQLEEGGLERQLRSAIANFKPLPTTDPRHKLHLAYYELVKKQLEGQTERAHLEQTSKEQDKYERLVKREVDRVSTSNDPIDQINESNTGAKP